MGYRGYGLPQAEVISEANVGLMQAVKRFDPEKGFRLATYAMWWIRASIQEYILRSWSLVKLGTTSAQKKLFFNLRKAKAKVGALEEGDLRPENVAQIAKDLSVTEEEVIDMNRRLSGSDASLNATVGSDGDGATQWQDWLEDEDSDQAGAYEERDEMDTRRALLVQAMAVLNDREKDILMQRRLADTPGDAGRVVRKLRRQPRTHPPDRGARLRKAAGPHARTGQGQGDGGPGVTVGAIAVINATLTSS
jgi:RNA polymerase sigma-32 factor